ncbi:hypothetical protein CEXT_550851 [Caerostris extrusa]|uniref:Uncharacterized protein n=1 Tax=Caerostris extrusa TaxID=172846 RepID=A0AAV4NVC4_CAEEX|nr:hypothetical protein CEXT_550851 [Caerostris extrusa]
MKGIPKCLSSHPFLLLIQKINTAGSSSSISKATFEIHTREPFPIQPFTLPLQNRYRRHRFGSMVQDSREGGLGWNIGSGWSMINHAIPKVQKCVSPQICSIITFWKVLSLGVMLLHLVQWLGREKEIILMSRCSKKGSLGYFYFFPFIILAWTLT